MTMLPRLDTEEQNMSVEDFLYELQKEVLDQLRFYLCDNLQPERIIPWLQTAKILSTEDCEHIRSFPTTKRKVELLLDIVKKSGPKCLLALAKAIEKSNKTQRFIATKLRDKYENMQQLPNNQMKLQLIQDITYYSDPPPYTSEDEHDLVPGDSTFSLICASGTSNNVPSSPPRSKIYNPNYSVPLSERVDARTPSVLTDPTTPFPSMYSAIGTSVRSFRTDDFPPSIPPSISELDQMEKIGFYQDQVRGDGHPLQSIRNDQRTQLSKIQRSTSCPSRRREPEEHDASLSWGNNGSFLQPPVLRDGPKENDDVLDDPGSDHCASSLLEGSVPVNTSLATDSYALYVPPSVNDSFEVSGTVE